MKKEYIQPTMTVVALKHQTHILAGSPYDSLTTPVSTYNADEDVIEDKGDIW